jgi:hypothetical protein
MPGRPHSHPLQPGRTITRYACIKDCSCCQQVRTAQTVQPHYPSKPFVAQALDSAFVLCRAVKAGAFDPRRLAGALLGPSKAELRDALRRAIENTNSGAPVACSKHCLHTCDQSSTRVLPQLQLYPHPRGAPWVSGCVKDDVA